ncbi:uncharacterized protein LOC18441354 isoform X2 [Amborella trichopoda]|uniref:uncharacterized protein LOC18441354 isoform X2 n=1 Tax=Amborella trichopoda TaxID=13333 RepID=UPI0005D39296|nr:uncharacterized protein LOC18441354 isoform X2 [Amborella trichopoda]|eukprot:XP_011626028.1 uncharacterized protein LOC18441354 isoform X2 [Amborella trichopoda]
MGASLSENDPESLRKSEPECLASSSSSSSSFPRSGNFSGDCSGQKCGVDPMVKIELDAALALAEFAELALLSSKNQKRGKAGDFTGKWGNKGRRSTMRQKSEVPVKVWGGTLPDLKIVRKWVKIGQDLTSNKDEKYHIENLCETALRDTVKTECGIEILKSRTKGSTGPVSGYAGKLKQPLSEDEKEARRLRRVQANRESARQTIRRRQVLCEELTRRAANLALDNESMKREMDLAMQEFLSLKETNQHLKERVAKMFQDEEKQAPDEDPPPETEKPASSPVQAPLVFYNGIHFTPIAWPPILQPLSTTQTPPVSLSNDEDDHLHAASRIHTSQGWGGNFRGSSGPSAFYVLPCPWLFSLYEQGPIPCPCDAPALREDGSLRLCQYDIESSRKPIITSSSCSVENQFDSKAPKIREKTARSVGESQPLLPRERSDRVVGHPSEELGLVPTMNTSIFTINRQSLWAQDAKDTNPNDNVTVMAAHSAELSPEFSPSPCLCQSKRSSDAAAATEARKRRKELTKLKNLHYRQLSRLQW